MVQKTVKKVVVLGSGALKIGEAGEFDYSGSQALKALREEGVRTVLINPNIATVQTSETLADEIYYLPVTPYFVEKVIEKECPDGILLSFGGQTALNCGIQLYKHNVFERFGVSVLGTPIEAVINTEDRDIFARQLQSLSVKTPVSVAVTSVSEAVKTADTLGFPLIIRSAYTLGGQGSAFCNDYDELKNYARKALSYSPQILVEESLKGWKEIEYEVVRDQFDNCITVCNMENFDPLGIHTGESIVVAPSQTLTNSEYHFLRSISLCVIRHFGIIGECNIQFALDPLSMDYRVIEVNARLSRSSALASKATGYPLAFVAAKLALGYGLHQLKNSVTKTTTACFEPSLDYIVCKIPRWDLKKFNGVTREIGSSMKSVGEVMAIGRTFEEAIQKGLRMIGQGMHGFVGNKNLEFGSIEESLQKPTDMRIFAIQAAFEQQFDVDQIHQLTKIDTWFLMRLKTIFDIMKRLESFNSLKSLPVDLLKTAKQAGFSDFQIARFVLKSTPENANHDMLAVRAHRIQHNIVPSVKLIDTLAAEYPAQTNYLYLTYHGTQHDITHEYDERSVIVLGSGPYRIGSSVEFDWCSVNALATVNQQGYRSVMINYNPETVSTDYDRCDRLYFDELTFERVMDIIDLENPRGVVVSMGGQIPNNLALRLHKQQVRILGTSALSIDRAEDRYKFSSMLDKIGVNQPRWQELTTMEDVYAFVKDTGFPVMIRPSYVLSGSAMNVVSNRSELEHFLKEAAQVSKQYPVVVSRFVENAKEIEIDAVAQNGEIIAYAISEHVEFAGVHSGDATIVFPPQKIYFETVRRIKKAAYSVARELDISGPLNIQFLAKDNEIMIIECNLRASRSMPFVSKILKVNLIDMATRVVLGETVPKLNKSIFDLEYVGIKASQFSFSRLSGADPVLGVEMVSTGEVGCLGDDVDDAILKSMLSVGYRIPEKNILLSSGPVESKAALLKSCRLLKEQGYTLYATSGSHTFLNDNNIDSICLYWPDEDKKPNVMDYLRQRKIDLVVNIPKNLTQNELSNDYAIRRAAIDFNIPLITNTRLAHAFIKAFCHVKLENLTIKSWREY